MKRIIFFLIPIFILLRINATVSDSLKVQKRIYKLEGIRVIAETPTEAIGSLKTVDYNDKMQAENSFIADVVEDFNGVDITDGGKGGSSISIRGFDEKQVKILVDGQPMNAGYFGEIDLYSFPIPEIKQIQLLKGPISSLYGSNNMGGVINIITKNRENLPVLKLGATFKRNNTNKFYLSVAKDFGDMDAEFFVSRYNTDGKVLSKSFEPNENENGYVLNHSAKKQYDFQTKLSYTLFGVHSLGLQAGYSFFDKKEEVNKKFTQVKDVYQKFQKIANLKEKKPLVMANLPYKGVWYVAGGNSFPAKLINDAGGEYVWKEQNSREAIPMSIENVITNVENADFWINSGFASSIFDVLSVDERIRELSVFKSGEIYNNNNIQNDKGGNDYFESGISNPHILLKDLISILHPEILPNYKRKYYHKLN